MDLDVENNDMTDFAIASTVTAPSLVIGVDLKSKKKKKQKRNVWTRSWLLHRHDRQGILGLLNNELKLEDPKFYKNFLRLEESQFNYLLQLISPLITKQDTIMRECIPSSSKLEVTLRFLATGESFRSLMYSTRIHESTISRFVPVVCEAIIKVLQEKYLKMPTSNDEWKKIALNFNNMWQFPHCLGALDGRHITFKAPVSDGSYYYNYKGRNSIVLLALSDANYKFIHICKYGGKRKDQ